MVNLGLYLLAAFMIGVVAIVYIRTNTSNKERLLFVGSLLLWFTYVYGIATAGLLDTFSMPPRVPLLVVVPAIITIVLFTRSKPFLSITNNIPIYIPIAMQTFRIAVELLIYAGYKEGKLPEIVTFSGMNFDIMSGVSTPIIAVLLYYDHISMRFAYLWNVATMIILIGTMGAFVHAFYFSDVVTSDMLHSFTTYPYLFIPSCLLPMAIFLHLWVFRSIRAISPQR